MLVKLHRSLKNLLDPVENRLSNEDEGIAGKRSAPAASEEPVAALQRRNEAGMTLIEMMIVLAIITMVMGIAGFVGFKRLNEAREKDTKLVMKQIKSSYLQWQINTEKTCPASLAEITDNNKEPKDGWSHPYTFKCPGDHDELDLISKGKDGQEGTADDIKSWVD